MKEINQNTLLKLAVPTASVEVHQAKLKQALHAAANADTNNLKSTRRMYMSRNKFILGGVALAAALVVGVSVSLFNSGGLLAYAQQVTQQSINAVNSLSPSQQSAVNLRVHTSIKPTLQAAEQAKDLVVLTYAQLTQSAHNPIPANDNSVDYASLKYLQYTDSSGALVTIGVDSQNIPVFFAAGMFAPGK